MDNPASKTKTEASQPPSSSWIRLYSIVNETSGAGCNAMTATQSMRFAREVARLLPSDMAVGGR
jgi:hypothetical protein